MTIGSYNSIVVPLCHCFCKILLLSVSIYNIQTTLIKHTMKEFLKFKSIGGASSLDIQTAGTYYIPIDTILVVDGDGIGPGGNVFIVWQNTPNTGVNVNYYAFELNTLPTTETYAAFNKALEANPGGKSIELQLPAGQEIIGWETKGEGIY